MEEKGSLETELTRRLNRRTFLKAALGVTGTALLAACAPAQAPSPTAAPKPAAPQPTAASGAPAAAPAPTAAPAVKVGTDTIRLVIGVDPDTLDPAGQTTTTIQNIVDYVNESLLSLGEDGKIHPALAESWEAAPDGKSYTFKLRQGVTFHDGTPFNAEAVKLSWDRLLSPDLKVPLRGLMTVIDSVTAVDPSTVRFNLKAPLPPFLAAMTASAYAIVSPNTAKNFPKTYNEEPVGTGPYMFKSRTKGSEVVLVRNEKYWGQKPYYQTVQFKIAPEAATRESLLLAGQADIIILPPISDIPKLQANNQVKVIMGQSDRTIYIAIDCTRDGPTKDKLFRQALNYAVDKEGIIKSILFGAGQVMDSPVASSLFGYSKCGPYPYDPNKAKEMLKQGGYSNVSLKMYYCTGRYLQDAAASQAIAGNLRDVGINVDASTMDWPTYLAAVDVPPEKATADMHMLGWAPMMLDAAQQMVQFQKSNWPPAGLATAHYTNPQVEDLLNKANENTNEKERAEQYAQANKIIWDDAPWIFLWVQNFPIVHSAKIKGVGSIATEKWSAIYAQPA
jgi:peptide/nickel transport system substrate-binding protein